MTRYTVAYTADARDQLATMWLESTSRSSISKAANAIDQLLAEDPELKGDEGVEGLRRLVAPPLVVHFTVEEADRTVTVWSVGGLRD